ncbi:GDP-mannose 4,6-dehydratase, partial [Chloroflexota bacterium]
NYGSRQHPEKFLPTVIINALRDKPVPVYGDGRYMRDWIHVQDHCRAADLILHRGQAGRIYNVAAHNEWLNIELVRKILGMMGKTDELIQFVKDRPGHDKRYAVDSTRIQTELQWLPEVPWEQGLSELIKWYSKTNLR